MVGIHSQSVLLFIIELSDFYMCFSHDHIEIMVNSAGELLFFRQRESPWMPTLKLLHKCNEIFKDEVENYL